MRVLFNWQARNRSPGRGGQSWGVLREEWKGKKMKFKDYKKFMMFNLRMFDEDPAGADGADKGAEGSQGGDNKGKETGRDAGGKKYDDAEVDRIVAKHRAEWEKKHAEDLKKATDEARKYERMSKEQKEEADKKKAEEEAARKDARIKELEEQIATDALRKTVAADVEAMEEGISVSQDFLDLVVTGDADASKANVQKLVGIILADRKAQEEKRARGTTPKSYEQKGGKVDPYSAIVNKYARK